MSNENILEAVGSYYSAKVSRHGATAAGVDWNSIASQELRFAQLLKVCNTSERFSINDFGCGYGALVDYLEQCGYQFDYSGYDIAPEMIEHATRLHRDRRHCTFLATVPALRVADYTIASGIFNVKINANEDDWQRYILDTLAKLSELSTKGFAFNVLTSYSDKDRMRPDLHYADPLYLFDYCKRNFSRYVALLHDYPLYEFTILVKKED